VAILLTRVPCTLLAAGAAIPLIGLGTWKGEAGSVKTAVAWALRCGYRHIDCAEVYNNEREVSQQLACSWRRQRAHSLGLDGEALSMLLQVGEALAQVFGEGVVARSDVFITSKLWNSDHRADQVRHSAVPVATCPMAGGAPFPHVVWQ
jgi:alcohol dehydrogenase (NADP+)